jgi:hypothetical protein
VAHHLIYALTFAGLACLIAATAIDYLLGK